MCANLMSRVRLPARPADRPGNTPFVHEWHVR